MVPWCLDVSYSDWITVKPSGYFCSVCLRDRRIRLELPQRYKVRYKVRNTILGGLVSGHNRHIYVDGVKKNQQY
jgi:hypothetical protein